MERSTVEGATVYAEQFDGNTLMFVDFDGVLEDVQPELFYLLDDEMIVYIDDSDHSAVVEFSSGREVDYSWPYLDALMESGELKPVELITG